ncbi:MAG: thioredoxin [Flavobacteriales bacterium AspAUS03]
MVQEVTDVNFKEVVLQSIKPVLVDFWASWCGPCVALSPRIDDLAEQYEGKVLVVKLNVDDSPETSGKYGIRSIPTLLFFKGGEEKSRQIGIASKENLSIKLEALL